MVFSKKKKGIRHNIYKSEAGRIYWQKVYSEKMYLTDSDVYKKALKEYLTSLGYQETYSDRVEIRKDIREIETRIKEIKQQNATAQTFINSSRGE